jgi:hypothetical protein
MKADRIRSMTHAKKFHPFDVRTTSGESYHVRSPEMVWVSPENDVMLVLDPTQGVAFIDVDQISECVRDTTRKPK